MLQRVNSEVLMNACCSLGLSHTQRRHRNQAQLWYNACQRTCSVVAECEPHTQVQQYKLSSGGTCAPCFKFRSWRMCFVELGFSSGGTQASECQNSNNRCFLQTHGQKWQHMRLAFRFSDDMIGSPEYKVSSLDASALDYYFIRGGMCRSQWKLSSCSICAPKHSVISYGICAPERDSSCCECIFQCMDSVVAVHLLTVKLTHGVTCAPVCSSVIAAAIFQCQYAVVVRCMMQSEI